MRRDIETLYAPEANDRFVRITRADGHRVYVSGAPKDEGFDPQHIPAPLAGRAVPAERAERFPGGLLLIAGLSAQGADGASYLVEVGASGTGTQATLAEVLILLAVGLPVAVLVAVGGGFVLVRQALEPVERIARKAEEITQHNLERAPAGGAQRG